MIIKKEKNTANIVQGAKDMIEAILERIEIRRIDLNGHEDFAVGFIRKDLPYDSCMVKAVSRYFKNYDYECKLANYKFSEKTNRNGYAFKFKKIGYKPTPPNFDDLPF